MGDYQDGKDMGEDIGEGSGKKFKKFEKFTKTPFFGFSKPYLDFIGKGNMYGIFYIVMAIVNLIIPFVILAKVIDSSFFRIFPAKYIFAFIFAWLVIIFACWIGFQLWWERKSIVKNIQTSEFIATPMVSEIVQTSGEWIGTFIGIVGAGVGLVALIFLGGEAGYLLEYMGLGFLATFGGLIIVAGPVIGFFIIILFRFLAEQLRIFAALANNTKEIASNIKEKSTIPSQEETSAI